MTQIEATPNQADWSREFKHWYQWEPSRSLLASIRSYQNNKAKTSKFNPIASIAVKIAVLRHRFWSVVTCADIPINTKIGGGLMMPHPNGIVLHPDATIGVNCIIFQQVTIGVTDKSQSCPIIGNHANIGAGAKILGDVTLGDYVKVGANAVVVKDVPAWHTAIGIPAKNVKFNQSAN